MSVHDNGDEQEGKRTSKSLKADALTGTTRRVYRYIYKHGPVRPNEIQRDLHMSSSSVADYHIQKLLRMRLIRDENGKDGIGYIAEEAVFEAMLRIRRTVIPLWTTAISFFAAGVIVLITILRPATISATYLFSLVIALVALSISVYEAIRSFGGSGI